LTFSKKYGIIIVGLLLAETSQLEGKAQSSLGDTTGKEIFMLILRDWFDPYDYVTGRPIFYEPDHLFEGEDYDLGANFRRRAQLPVTLFWNNWERHFTDCHVVYDIKEQVYKRRRSYFHISTEPLVHVQARVRNGRSVPVAFFALDAKFCFDYFKIASGGMRWKYAFLHHCVNFRPMNLFNTDSDSDFNSLPVSVQLEIARLSSIFPPENTGRYWEVLESKWALPAIYANKKPKFDGLALNFKNPLSKPADQVSGIGLFSRGENKMDVVLTAVVENPYQSVNLKNLVFRYPKEVRADYENGKYQE
jgi:hypothetical protein